MSLINDIVRLPNGLLGVAASHYDGITYIHKFGANFQIDGNTDPESIWTGGGLYPWAALNTAQTLYILSTEAGDTQEYEITGLNAFYHEIVETVTLTGLTAVTTANQFIRIYRIINTSATNNAGTITARTVSGTGTVVAQIDPSFNQTLMAIYTIPANHTGYLLKGDFSIKKGEGAQIHFYIRPFGSVFRIAHIAEAYESTYEYTFPVPMPIPEKSDVDVQAFEVLNNNTRVTTNFDILLVRNI